MTDPTITPAQPLPFNEWITRKGTTVPGPDEYRDYVDYANTELLRNGLYDDQLAAEIEQEVANLAAESGVTADPNDYLRARRPDQDFDLLTRRAIETGDDDMGNAVRTYQAVKGSRDIYDDEVEYQRKLEEARLAAEPFLDPERVNDARRAALDRGDLPFVVIDQGGDKPPLIQFGPAAADIQTDEDLAAAFDANPDLDRRFIGAVRQKIQPLPGFDAPAWALDRQMDFQAAAARTKVTDTERYRLMVRDIANGNTDAFDRTLADLSTDPAFASFTPDERRNFLMDMAKMQGQPEVDPQNVAASLRTLSTGQVHIPNNVMFNKDYFDQALQAVPEGQHARIKNIREAHMEAVAPEMFKGIAEFSTFTKDDPSDPFRTVFVDFYEQAKAAGKSNGEILDEWMSNPDNHSKFWTRARGLTMGVVSAFTDIPVSLAALAGSEGARDILVENQRRESARKQYANLFGDKFGIGYDAANLIAPVGVDLTLAAAAGPTGGATAGLLAAKTGAKAVVKSALRRSLSAETKTLLSQFTRKAAARQATRQGLDTVTTPISTSAVLTLAGRDFAQTVSRSATQATVLGTAFTRSAGSTYASLHATLSNERNADGTPRYTPEQVREIALGHALTSGAITASVVGAFQFLGAKGVERLLSGGFTPAQARQIHARLKLNPEIAKQYGVSLESPEKMIESAVRNATTNFLRAGVEEGGEEFVDQMAQSVNEALATGERFDVVKATKDALYAGTLGFAMGAGMTGAQRLAGRPLGEDRLQLERRSTLLQLANKFDAHSPNTAAALRAAAAEPPPAPAQKDVPAPPAAGGPEQAPSDAGVAPAPEGQVTPPAGVLQGFEQEKQEIEAQIQALRQETGGTTGQVERRKRQITRLTGRMKQLDTLIKNFDQTIPLGANPPVDATRVPAKPAAETVAAPPTETLETTEPEASNEIPEVQKIETKGRARMAERILVRAGVDPESASVIATRIASEVDPDGQMDIENFRAAVLNSFDAMGGESDQNAQVYDENPASYSTDQYGRTPEQQAELARQLNQERRDQMLRANRQLAVQNRIDPETQDIANEVEQTLAEFPAPAGTPTESLPTDTPTSGDVGTPVQQELPGTEQPRQRTLSGMRDAVNRRLDQMEEDGKGDPTRLTALLGRIEAKMLRDNAEGADAVRERYTSTVPGQTVTADAPREVREVMEATVQDATEAGELQSAEIFSRSEIEVGKPQTTSRKTAVGRSGKVVTLVSAPGKVLSSDTYYMLSDGDKIRVEVEGRIAEETGKAPKKSDPVWTVRVKGQVMSRNLTYAEAIEAAKDVVYSANPVTGSTQQQANDESTKTPSNNGEVLGFKLADAGVDSSVLAVEREDAASTPAPPTELDITDIVEPPAPDEEIVANVAAAPAPELAIETPRIRNAVKRKLKAKGIDADGMTDVELAAQVTLGAATETAPTPSLPEKKTKPVKPGKTDHSRAIPEYPLLETEYRNVGKKQWLLLESRTQAVIGRGDSKQEALGEARRNLLWQQVWNEDYQSVYEMADALIAREKMPVEPYGIADKYKPTKAEMLEILNKRKADIEQEIENDIKQAHRVGAIPGDSVRFARNFLEHINQRIAKLENEKGNPPPDGGGSLATPAPLQPGDPITFTANIPGVMTPTQGVVDSIKPDGSIVARVGRTKYPNAQIVETAPTAPTPEEVQAAIETTLSAKDKEVAAAELDASEWNADTATTFARRMADWITSGIEASEKLAAMFARVAKAISKTAMALIAMVSITANTTTEANIQTIEVEEIAARPAGPSPSEIADVQRRAQGAADAAGRVAGSLRDAAVSAGQTIVNAVAPTVDRMMRQADFGKVKPSDNARKMADWIVKNQDNNGLVFTIADKSEGSLYFFSPEGKLIKKSPALFGSTPGDVHSPSRLSMTMEQIRNDRRQQITPAGRFETETARSNAYGQVVPIAKTGRNSRAAIHKVFTGRPQERRTERMDPQGAFKSDPLRTRVSLGCINVPDSTAKAAARMFEDGGVVYVMPDTEKGKSLFEGFAGLDAKFQPSVSNTPVARDLQRLGIQDGSAAFLRNVIERGPKEYRTIARILSAFTLPNPTLVDLPDANYAGEYSPRLNRIRINVARRGPRGPVDTVIHELIHAALEDSLRNPTDAQRKILNRLERIRQTVMKRAEALGNLEINYGLSSMDEFFTHFLTSPEFQRQIGAMTPKGQRNWVEVILDALRSLFSAKLKTEADKQIETIWNDMIRFTRSAAEEQYGPHARTTDGRVLLLPAYHGTPHKVDKFSLSKIGTGEGAQAYGWGLYFAEDRGVAEYYKNKVRPNLSPEMQEYMLESGITDFNEIVKALEDYIAKFPRWRDINTPLLNEAKQMRGFSGNIYTVELLVDDDQLLDWDKPLKDHSEVIQSKLQQEFKGLYRPELRAGDWHNWLVKNDTDPRTLSQDLLNLGIKGIRFLDGASRNRPFKEIKKTFLDALPDDAEFGDVQDAIDAGAFNADQIAFLKALEADDWFGFDYPAQAISAALSDRISNWDPSPELLESIKPLRGNATYNYVIFDENDIQITAENGKPVTATQATTPEPGPYGLSRMDQLRMQPADLRDLSRFKELTADLGETPTQADIDAWKTANPDKYAELQRMREAVLRDAGYNLKAWHGTDTEGAFNEFDPQRIGQNWRPELGRGFYFSPDRSFARAFGRAQMMETLLKIENPLEWTTANGEQAINFMMDLRLSDPFAIPDKAKAQGHDGIITGDGQIVVFDPNQIKSTEPLNLDADGRLITPDRWADVESPDIRFQPVSEPTPAQTPDTLRETAIGFLPDGFTLDDLDINFDQLAEDVSDTDPVNAEELIRSAVNYEVARVAAERELGDDYDPMFAETYYKLLTGNLPDADKAFYIGNPNAMERLIRFLTSALRRLTTAIELQFDRHTATAVNRISRALVDAERGFRVRPDYVMMGGDVTMAEDDIRFQPILAPDNRISHFQDVYMDDPQTDADADTGEPRNWFQRMFVDKDDLPRPQSKLFLNRRFSQKALESTLKNNARDFKLIQKKTPADLDLVSRALPSNRPTLTKADTDRINAEFDARLADLWTQESAAIAARENIRDEQLKASRSTFLRAGKSDPGKLGTWQTEYEKRDRQINSKAKTDIAAISADYRVRREQAMEQRKLATVQARLARADEMRRESDLALEELEKVNPDMAQWVIGSRMLIDDAQSVVKSVYGDSPQLQMLIDATRGAYMVRTYRIHQDPGYAKKFLTDPKYRKAYSQLVNYFEDQLVEQEKENIRRMLGEGNFEITEEEITNSRVKNKAERLKRLSKGENYNDADIEAIARAEVQDQAKTIAEDWIMGHGDSQTLVPQGSSSSIKVDFTRFLEKKDLDPILLEALGEITDPLFNTTRTIESLATIAQNRKFLAAYVRTGTKLGNLISKEEYESNPSKYRGWDTLVGKDERNPAYAPLSGYYAPPEHILAFKAVVNQNRTVPTSTAGKAFDRVNRVIMGSAGWSLAFVVMGNTASAVRNIFGGGLLASRQGIVAAMTAPFKQEGRAAYRAVYEAIFDPVSRKVNTDVLNEYIALGVILNGVDTNYLREMYEQYGSDQETFAAKIQELVAKGSKNAAEKFGKVREGTSAAGEYIGKIWEFTETLYNVVVFENELGKLREAGFGTEQQMKQEAADRMRMLLPSHSEQSQGVREFTKSPVAALVAPFIRFKTDMIRTTVNTYRLAIKDLNSGNPVLAKYGRERLASAFTVDAILTASVPLLMQALMGIGDDEDEAIRSAMPDYAKNANFYYSLDRATGELTTYDLTYLNPMSFVIDPFVNMYRAVASGNAEEIPAIAAQTVGQEFLGENVLAGLVIDVKRNKDQTTGKSIYLDTDTDAEKIRKSLAHVVGGAYTPAVGKVLYRTYQAAIRDQESDQFFFSPVGQAMNLFLPVKPRAQFVQDMAYRSFSETRAMNAQLWQTMSASRSPRPMDSSEIADMYQARVDGTLRVWSEFYNHAKGFEKLGMTRSEILATARRAGLSQDRTRQVVTRGTTDRPVESAEALEKMRAIDPERVRVYLEQRDKTARNLNVTGK